MGDLRFARDLLGQFDVPALRSVGGGWGGGHLDAVAVPRGSESIPARISAEDGTWASAATTSRAPVPDRTIERMMKRQNRIGPVRGAAWSGTRNTIRGVGFRTVWCGEWGGVMGESWRLAGRGAV